MSHNTLRSSLFPDTAYKFSYKDIWNDNNLPYYLFETRINPSHTPNKQNLNSSKADPLHKNPFKRTHSNQQQAKLEELKFPDPFPKHILGSIIPKESQSQSFPILVPHPENQFNNSIFRGYIKNGKKHGFCAFRLSLGEIIILYFYENIPLAFETTIFYQNSESCSITNQYGYSKENAINY